MRKLERKNCKHGLTELTYYNIFLIFIKNEANLDSILDQPHCFLSGFRYRMINPLK
jgi:hypothetical protein